MHVPVTDDLELLEHNQILRWIYYHICLLYQDNFLAFKDYMEIMVCVTIFTIYRN